ncbi:response regulator [Pseudomonas sp. PHC1]|uniref:response regulator transcription factor n=1 Tax=Pseudomonas sp. PHC1 TaxID=3384759 RepID=UPI00396F3158
MRWSTLSPLRICLLDDHALIREALKIRLALESDFKIVGTYARSNELLEALRNQEADLVVLDYQLTDGDLDGIRLIQLVRSHYPDLRILIFSSLERPATINLSIRAGANGFVGKSQETDDLIKAIRVVATGKIYLAPEIAAEQKNFPKIGKSDESLPFQTENALINNTELSPKEREVLRCCLEGLSVIQIAAKFSRSRKTISGQKQAAFKKLGIKTDTELFKLHSQLQET